MGVCEDCEYMTKELVHNPYCGDYVNVVCSKYERMLCCYLGDNYEYKKCEECENQKEKIYMSDKSENVATYVPGMPPLEQIQEALKTIHRVCQSVMGTGGECDYDCPLFSRNDDMCGLCNDMDRRKFNKIDSVQIHRFFD